MTLPRFVEPELATRVTEVPEGPGWVFEIKYDGYRLLARIEDGEASLWSRNRKLWTDRVPAEITRALEALPVRDALLDGELVALLKDGRTDFQTLQNRLGTSTGAPVRYLAFDLLHLDGRDLRSEPLIERKGALLRILETAAPELGFADHLEGRGQLFFEQACAHGLEGVMAKRIAAPYRSGRGRDWLKIKCSNQAELVIGGFTEPSGARHGFGALLLGVYDDRGRLSYAGKVGTGFDEATLRSLMKKLEARIIARSPFADPPRERRVRWVKPELVAVVRYQEWTADGVLRHPSFLGLREDKPAEEVRPEVAEPTIPLSNPDRVFYPELGITKRELARYYARIAASALPEIAGRPLSLLRCPEGWQGQCFFQKHEPRGAPASLWRITIPEGGREATYLTLDSLDGLIGLVQMGVLEIHTFGCRYVRLETPDRMIFDLDPAPELAWPALRQGALELRALLETLGLASFVKTTGGKGLHVVVPLTGRQGWDEVKAFSRAVALHLAAGAPARYTANMSKAKRAGRIFVDYLRNGFGATAIAPYSARAREGAPVATPLAWDELAGDRPQFSLRTLPDRLDTLKHDPWAELSRVRQSLSQKAKKKLRVSVSRW